MKTTTLESTEIESEEDYAKQQELAEVRGIFRAVAGGDRVAFAELHRRFSGLVYATAIQVLHNHQDTEDVTQVVGLPRSSLYMSAFFQRTAKTSCVTSSVS